MKKKRKSNLFLKGMKRLKYYCVIDKDGKVVRRSKDREKLFPLSKFEHILKKNIFFPPNDFTRDPLKLLKRHETWLFFILAVLFIISITTLNTFFLYFLLFILGIGLCLVFSDKSQKIYSIMLLISLPLMIFIMGYLMLWGYGITDGFFTNWFDIFAHFATGLVATLSFLALFNIRTIRPIIYFNILYGIVWEFLEMQSYYLLYVPGIIYQPSMVWTSVNAVQDFIMHAAGMLVAWALYWNVTKKVTETYKLRKH